MIKYWVYVLKFLNFQFPALPLITDDQLSKNKLLFYLIKILIITEAIFWITEAKFSRFLLNNIKFYLLGDKTGFLGTQNGKKYFKNPFQSKIKILIITEAIFLIT